MVFFFFIYFIPLAIINIRIHNPLNAKSLYACIQHIFYKQSSNSPFEIVNFPKTPEVRVASVTDVQSGVYRGRSKSLLVSGWSDWSKSRKNVLMAGFTSSSLTNLRVQPGTETLNNAVMQLRRAPTNTIVEVDQDNETVDVENISQKTPRAFRSR
jgi:hypothetical protein